MEIQENFELKDFTTFGVGGAARYFIVVNKRSELSVALDYAQNRGLPYVLLAGGSNVLVADEGFNGVVIKLNFAQSEVNVHTGEVQAEAGCSLMGLIKEVTEKGLEGMESMYGIPGSVGAAARGNAGAFGTEMIDVVTAVEALNVDTREVRTFRHGECQFAYRNSFFKKNPEWIVLSVALKLQHDTEGTSVQKAEETLALRNERQIQDIRSAGSFFMNPVVHEFMQAQFTQEKGVEAKEGRVPAGWLIDKSGFKGVCEDGACTGERSANYIINDGNATAAAIKSLSEKIHTAVGEQFAVDLRPEVTLVGF